MHALSRLILTQHSLYSPHSCRPSTLPPFHPSTLAPFPTNAVLRARIATLQDELSGHAWTERHAQDVGVLGLEDVYTQLLAARDAPTCQGESGEGVSETRNSHSILLPRTSLYLTPKPPIYIYLTSLSLALYLSLSRSLSLSI